MNVVLILIFIEGDMGHLHQVASELLILVKDDRIWVKLGQILLETRRWRSEALHERSFRLERGIEDSEVGVVV